MVRHPDGSIECIINQTGCCDVSGDVGEILCITDCPICATGTSSQWTFTIESVGGCETVTIGTKVLEYDPNEDNECRWTYHNGEENWELFYDFQAPEGFQRWYLVGGLNSELLYVAAEINCFDSGVNVFTFVDTTCGDGEPDEQLIIDPVDPPCEAEVDCIADCPICPVGAASNWQFELASVGECTDIFSSTSHTLLYEPTEENPCRWAYSHAGEEWEMYYDEDLTLWLLVGGDGVVIYGTNDLDCLHSGVNEFALLFNEECLGMDEEVQVDPVSNNCSSFECDAGSCVEIDELGGYETMEECEENCEEGTIETVCCPDNLLPETLYLHIEPTGECSCADGSVLTLTYDVDEDRWLADEPFGQCGMNLVAIFRCFDTASDSFILSLGFSGLCFPFPANIEVTSYSCEPPLEISFSGPGPSSCGCEETAAINYVVRTTP